MIKILKKKKNNIKYTIFWSFRSPGDPIMSVPRHSQSEHRTTQFAEDENALVRAGRTSGSTGNGHQPGTVRGRRFESRARLEIGAYRPRTDISRSYVVNIA